MKSQWRFLPVLILLLAGSLGCPGSNSPTNPGSTDTPTATLGSPVPTSTATSTATVTPTGTPSSTATPTGTPTPTSSPTATFTPTGTSSPTSTATSTATSSSTPTFTATPTNTFPTSTFTSTATSTATSSATPTATNTRTVTPTNTATATPTPTITSTPTATGTPTLVYPYLTTFGSASLTSPDHLVAVGSSPVSLFVTDQISSAGKVVVFNGSTGVSLTSFSTLHIPEGLAVNSAGTTLYVVEESSGTASYIEYYTAAGARQTGLETPLGNPFGIDVALDSSAGKLYALSENTGGINHDKVEGFTVGSTSASSSFNLNSALTLDLTGIALDANYVYISTDLAYVTWYNKSSGVSVGQFNVASSSTAQDVKPDGSGNFLIPVDIFPGSYVQKVSSSFSALVQFGNSQFNTANPSGVAVDSSGNVYVLDKTNHQIVKYAPH